MAHRLPKIAPMVIARKRVQAWLEFHAQSPVRCLIAPAGSGKTTCAVLYARSRPQTVAFVSALPGWSQERLIAALSAAAGGAAGTYAELIDGLAAAAPLELIVDHCDDLAPDARDILARIFLDVPDGVTFLYIARSRDVVSALAAQSRGLVDMCDPALLAFDQREIAALATSLGCDQDSANITRLHEATFGWAFAVSGICRTAAAGGLRFPEAIRYWRRLNDLTIRELAQSATAGVPAAIAAAFSQCVAGRAFADVDQLQAMQRAGLFVFEWNGRPMLNPLVRHDAHADVATVSDAPVPAAYVEMFGRFDVVVDGRSVSWVRRRDRQIVQYLAMRPNSRATRSEIIAAFWPEADRQLAGQSLRSACSTIRRAIGECVGRSHVERYFVADQYLELNLDHVVISARRFEQCFELAEAAYRRGDVAAAFGHFRTAEQTYVAPFLAGEPPAMWAIPYESRFAAMNATTADRLDELHRTIAAAEAARVVQRALREQVSA